MYRARISYLLRLLPLSRLLALYPAVKSVPLASDTPAVVQRSVRGRLGARIQKRRRMPCKGLVELKERTVARVRISQKDGIRQVLAQPIGVPNRNHLIVDSIYDEGRRQDAFQIGEAICAHLIGVVLSSGLIFSGCIVVVV